MASGPVLSRVLTKFFSCRVFRAADPHVVNSLRLPCLLQQLQLEGPMVSDLKVTTLSCFRNQPEPLSDKCSQALRISLGSVHPMFCILASLKGETQLACCSHPRPNTQIGDGGCNLVMILCRTQARNLSRPRAASVQLIHPHLWTMSDTWSV